jgi:hypothetical protein
MVRIRRSEDIVCDIATHGVYIVLPLDRRGHALHFTDNLALGQDASSIRITLDVVLTTSPGPLSAPFNPGSGSAIKVGTLRSVGGSVFAPKVVQDFVTGFCMVGILSAETDLFLDGGDFLTHGGRSSGCGYSSC